MKKFFFLTIILQIIVQINSQCLTYFKYNNPSNCDENCSDVNCLNCQIDTGECLECQPGYLLISGETSTCSEQKCNQNCQSCKSIDACQQCFWSFETDTCIKVNASTCPLLLPGYCEQKSTNICEVSKACLSCESNNGYCTVCEGWFYPRDNSCRPSPEQQQVNDADLIFSTEQNDGPQLTNYIATLQNITDISLINDNQIHKLQPKNLIEYCWLAITTSSSISFQPIMTMQKFILDFLTINIDDTQDTKFKIEAIRIASEGLAVLASFGGDFNKMLFTNLESIKAIKIELIYLFDQVFEKFPNDQTLYYDEMIILQLIGATDNILRGLEENYFSTGKTLFSDLKVMVKNINKFQQKFLNLLSLKRFSRIESEQSNSNQQQLTTFYFTQKKELQIQIIQVNASLTGDFIMSFSDGAEIIIENSSEDSQFEKFVNQQSKVYITAIYNQKNSQWISLTNAKNIFDEETLDLDLYLTPIIRVYFYSGSDVQNLTLQENKGIIQYKLPILQPYSLKNYYFLPQYYEEVNDKFSFERTLENLFQYHQLIEKLLDQPQFVVFSLKFSGFIGITTLRGSCFEGFYSSNPSQDPTNCNMKCHSDCLSCFGSLSTNCINCQSGFSSILNQNSQERVCKCSNSSQTLQSDGTCIETSAVNITQINTQNFDALLPKIFQSVDDASSLKAITEQFKLIASKDNKSDTLYLQQSSLQLAADSLARLSASNLLGKTDIQELQDILETSISISNRISECAFENCQVKIRFMFDNVFFKARNSEEFNKLNDAQNKGKITILDYIKKFNLIIENSAKSQFITNLPTGIQIFSKGSHHDLSFFIADKSQTEINIQLNNFQATAFQKDFEKDNSHYYSIFFYAQFFYNVFHLVGNDLSTNADLIFFQGYGLYTDANNALSLFQPSNFAEHNIKIQIKGSQIGNCKQYKADSSSATNFGIWQMIDNDIITQNYEGEGVQCIIKKIYGPWYSNFQVKYEYCPKGFYTTNEDYSGCTKCNNNELECKQTLSILCSGYFEPFFNGQGNEKCFCIDTYQLGISNQKYSCILVSEAMTYFNSIASSIETWTKDNLDDFEKAAYAATSSEQLTKISQRILAIKDNLSSNVQKASKVVRAVSYNRFFKFKEHISIIKEVIDVIIQSETITKQDLDLLLEGIGFSFNIIQQSPSIWNPSNTDEVAQNTLIQSLVTTFENLKKKFIQKVAIETFKDTKQNFYSFSYFYFGISQISSIPTTDSPISYYMMPSLGQIYSISLKKELFTNKENFPYFLIQTIHLTNPLQQYTGASITTGNNFQFQVFQGTKLSDISSDFQNLSTQVLELSFPYSNLNDYVECSYWDSISENKNWKKISNATISKGVGKCSFLQLYQNGMFKIRKIGEKQVVEQNPIDQKNDSLIQIPSKTTSTSDGKCPFGQYLSNNQCFQCKNGCTNCESESKCVGLCGAHGSPNTDGSCGCLQEGMIFNSFSKTCISTYDAKFIWNEKKQLVEQAKDIGQLSEFITYAAQYDKNAVKQVLDTVFKLNPTKLETEQQSIQANQLFANLIQVGNRETLIGNWDKIEKLTNYIQNGQLNKDYFPSFLNGMSQALQISGEQDIAKQESLETVFKNSLKKYADLLNSSNYDISFDDGSFLKFQKFSSSQNGTTSITFPGQGNYSIQYSEALHKVIQQSAGQNYLASFYLSDTNHYKISSQKPTSKILSITPYKVGSNNVHQFIDKISLNDDFFSFDIGLVKQNQVCAYWNGSQEIKQWDVIGMKSEGGKCFSNHLTDFAIFDGSYGKQQFSLLFNGLIVGIACLINYF